MTDDISCPTVRDGDDDIPRRWVSGNLPADEAREFEVHLLTCHRCQKAVEYAAGITATLRGAVVKAPQPRRWPVWLIPAALAAGLVILFWPRDPLRRLADPGPAPTFSSALIRAEADDGEAAERGMTAYGAGDYRQATEHLTAAATMGSTPGLLFFLGVSRLLSGNAVDAVAALEMVARDAAGPYSAEAQLWLAKGLLRVGSVDSAQAILGALARRPDAGPLATHARALADSVTRVRPR